MKYGTLFLIASASPTFGNLYNLPRGPHRLSRKEVAAAQRTRLLAATAALVAEQGYVAVTITAITRRAGVSPNAFYAHFADKQACFLAAYDVYAQQLLERVGAAVALMTDWEPFVATATRAYLDAIDADPEAARAFLLEMDAAGPAARARRHDAFAAFAAVIRARHELIVAADPALELLPDRAYLGLTLGVRGLVCDALDRSPGTPLIELAPDLERWLTATVRGSTR